MVNCLIYVGLLWGWWIKGNVLFDSFLRLWIVVNIKVGICFDVMFGNL